MKLLLINVHTCITITILLLTFDYPGYKNDCMKEPF